MFKVDYKFDCYSYYLYFRVKDYKGTKTEEIKEQNESISFNLNKIQSTLCIRE